MTRAIVFDEIHFRGFWQAVIIVAWLALLLSSPATGAQQAEADRPPLPSDIKALGPEPWL